MTLEEIYAAKESWKDRIDLIKEGAINPTDNITEYGGGREVRDNQVGNRPNKLKSDGSTAEVNKIAIPFAKQITRTAAAFLFGAPVTITAADIDMQPLRDQWEDLRLNPKMLQLCEAAKAFQQSALLFRILEAEGDQEKRQTVTLLTPDKGSLVPVWATFDSMDGFLYETKVVQDGKEVTKYYIYDAVNVLILVDNGSEITEESNTAHGYDKIPIVYVEEDEVEWHDVKPLIDRFENRYSRFADTNDYFSSPFFKASGKLGEAKPDKDDTGTVFELDIWETEHGNIIKSDIDVVAWDAAPEATKLELEMGKGLIYDLSSTPDLSFDNVKGLGNISGVALELMFLAPLIKSRFSEATYNVAVKRVISVMLSGMNALGVEGANTYEEAVFTVRFGSILPDHLQEMISILSEATVGRPLMSQRTALKHNPLVQDVDQEMDDLQAEEAAELGGTVNP